MFGHADPVHRQLHRIYEPLPSKQINVYETPLRILWTGKTKLSDIDTSSPWLPDRVVPVLPKVSNAIHYAESKLCDIYFHSKADCSLG